MAPVTITGTNLINGAFTVYFDKTWAVVPAKRVADYRHQPRPCGRNGGCHHRGRWWHVANLIGGSIHLRLSAMGGSDHAAGTQSSGVGIMYDLSDDESDSCSIQVNYSINGGSTWYPATAVSGSDTSSLSSSPNGSPHYYVWDSVADLGYVANSNVQIEITPTAAGVSGAAIATYSFTVDNTTVLPPPTINSPGDTSAPGQVLPNSQPTFTWTAVPGPRPTQCTLRTQHPTRFMRRIPLGGQQTSRTTCRTATAFIGG